MSKRTMPGWVKNLLIFGGISAIALYSVGCKPLQNMQNKKAEKKQAEYNEIYNKAYNDAYTQISKENNDKKEIVRQDTSKCIFFIIADPKSK